MTRFEILGDNKRLFISSVLIDFSTKELCVELLSKGTYHKFYKNTKGYYVKLNGKNYYITNQKEFQKSIDKAKNL